MSNALPLDIGPGDSGARLRGESLEILEFHLVRERLAAHTTFPPARELALSLEPSYQSTQVAARQQETTEARRYVERGSSLDLAEAGDLRDVLQRASLGGVLTGEELRQVHETLRVLHRTRSAGIQQGEFPLLGTLVHGLPVLRELEVELASAIGKSGEVLDGASPALSQLRLESRAAYHRLNQVMDRSLRRFQRQDLVQEQIITERNGRLVLLIKAEMRSRVPGIVHDVSDSGASRRRLDRASMRLSTAVWMEVGTRSLF